MFFFLSSNKFPLRLAAFLCHSFSISLSVQSMIDELKIIEEKIHACTPYPATNICKLKIMIHFPYEHIARSIAESYII